MPIYMDRHDLGEAVTAEAVAKVHQEDLKIQHHYGCRGITYWFDEKRGTAFCLIEAPEESAVKNMHNDAHGMIPNQIIQVDTQLVNAFLGRIEDPGGSDGLNIINEAAWRAIMITCLADAPVLSARVGTEKAHTFMGQHNRIIRKAIQQFHGREVKCNRGSFIVSFRSVIKGLQCAQEIRSQIQLLKHEEAYLKIKIGIATGSPVNKSPELFGKTISLTQRLCHIASGDQIVMSSEMKEELAEELTPAFFTDRTRALNPVDENFLNQVIGIIESMWNVTDFNTNAFGRKLGLSKAQLYRKMTQLTGLSTNDFIKEYRLKKAVEAIGKQEGNVSEIAYHSGFNSPSYFSKCFLERFGILPSSFAASVN